MRRGSQEILAAFRAGTAYGSSVSAAEAMAARMSSGVAVEDLGVGGSLGELAEDELDGDAGAPDDGLAEQDAGVDLDAVGGGHRACSLLPRWVYPATWKSTRRASDTRREASRISMPTRSPSAS